MLDQSIVDELIAGGELPPQIENVRAFYRGKRGDDDRRRSKSISAAARRWTSADGGLFTFVTSQRRHRHRRAHPRRGRGGVAYIPGGPFFVDGSGRNTMRLTFAKESDERIREGIARLARILL